MVGIQGGTVGKGKHQLCPVVPLPADFSHSGLGEAFATMRLWAMRPDWTMARTLDTNTAKGRAKRSFYQPRSGRWLAFQSDWN